jgi:hypothetical protein
MTIGFNEIKLEEGTAGKIVTLVFKGKISQDDYELFVPQLEGLMGQDEKIRLLVELRDFEGWTAGAAWEETKFAVKHFNDIERLTVVGDRQWEKAMTKFMKAFTTASVKYFDMSDMEAAKQWIREG